MMEQQKYNILKRIKSFKYAFNGLKILLKEEHNARIHFVAAIFVIIAGIYFSVSRLEWIAIIFAIASVISLEAFNSAIENISDFISPEKHNIIKKIKDLSAAGVLVCAIGALVIALVVFLPKIIALCLN